MARRTAPPLHGMTQVLDHVNAHAFRYCVIILVSFLLTRLVSGR